MFHPFLHSSGSIPSAFRFQNFEPLLFPESELFSVINFSEYLVQAYFCK